MLGVGCVLLEWVLQTAGRRSLDVRCSFFVASFCSCVCREWRIVFVAERLAIQVSSMRVYTCCTVARAICCKVAVCTGSKCTSALGLIKWRVACVSVARTSGVGSSGACCPACQSIATPCGCAWPPAIKRALTSKHKKAAPGGGRGECGVALPPMTYDIAEAACREAAEEQPRRFRLSAY